MLRDVSKADEALKVLETERANWKMVCEKFGSTLTEAKAKNGGVPEMAKGFDSSQLDLSSRKVEKDFASGNGQKSDKEKGRPAGKSKPPKKGSQTADPTGRHHRCPRFRSLTRGVAVKRTTSGSIDKSRCST